VLLQIATKQGSGDLPVVSSIDIGAVSTAYLSGHATRSGTSAGSSFSNHPVSRAGFLEWFL
jgi:hypothetical protein